MSGALACSATVATLETPEISRSSPFSKSFISPPERALLVTRQNRLYKTIGIDGGAEW